MLVQDDIINIGLSLVEIFGGYAKQSSRKVILFRILNGIMMAIVLYFVCVNVFYVHGEDYIECMEGISSIMHVIMKYCMLIYYNDDFKKLFGDIAKFWEPPHELQKEVYTTNRIARKLQTYLLVLYTATILAFESKSLINSKYIYLHATWRYEKSLVVEAIVLLMQFYVVSASLFCVGGCDCVYYSLCVHLTLQLKILKYEISRKENNVEVSKQKLNKCVRHHQLLILMFERMRATYYLILLVQYIITMGTACSELYILVASKPTLFDTVRAIFYTNSLFFQFGFYCIPAERVVSEILDVSNAIYTSNWYDTPPNYQKGLIIMMIRTQRQKNLSAGSLIDINVEGFGMVCRRVFSFYALMRKAVS